MLRHISLSTGNFTKAHASLRLLSRHPPPFARRSIFFSRKMSSVKDFKQAGVIIDLFRGLLITIRLFSSGTSQVSHLVAVVFGRITLQQPGQAASVS